MADNVTESARDNSTVQQKWTTVVREWSVRKEKEEYKSWKDEVAKLMLFSGLFFWVITAFLIQSLKGSLYLIATAPTTVSIIVNTLSFLGLVFTFTAMLFGFISFHWIGPHMRGRLVRADSLGLSYMHSPLQSYFPSVHSPLQSYFPSVLDSLSILLTSGLTCFWIGVMVLLVNLDWRVGIPTIFIAWTFVFLALTTVHSALKSLPAQEPSRTIRC